MVTAFVLGGGGVLGAVEVGMLRALLERDIVPDLVLGTSVGALNGAMVARQPELAVVDRLTGMEFTRPPSRKCSPSTSAGGRRPGTAALARLAGTIGPSVNQCSAARSMLAAHTSSRTGRSSKRAPPSSSSNRARSGAEE